MSERWTAEKVLGKVYQEGGIYEAVVHWGITDDMVPEQYASRWDKMQELMYEACEIWSDLSDEMEDDLSEREVNTDE